MTRNEQIQLIISAKDQASSILNNLKKSVIGIGTAYLSWRGVKDIITGITKAGMESERVYNDLSASIIRHGEAWDKLKFRMYDYTASIQSATSYSDELVTEGLTKLINYGMKTAEAMRSMKVATDLARGSNMDILAAVDLVGKAYVGYTATLSRYGIILDENISKSQKFAKAIEQIQQRFGGAAEAYMNTVSGQMDLLVERWSDVKEQIYNVTEAGSLLYAFITGLNAALLHIPLVIKSGFDAFKTLFDTLKVWIKKGANNLVEFGKLLWTVFTGKLKDIVAQFGAFQASLNDNIKSMTAAAEKSIDAAIIYAANWSLAITSGIDKGIAAYKKFFDLIKNPPPPKAQTDAISNTKQIMEGYSEDYKRLVDSWMDYERNQMEKSYYEWQRIQEDKLAAAQQFQDDMTSITMSGVDQIIDELYDGQLRMRTIFKNMARDFLKYFVNSALSSLVGGFVKGLLGVIGSIFDTRANDAIAMKQGADFAMYFTRGALAYLGQPNYAGRIAVAGRGIINYAPLSSRINTGNITQNFYFHGISDEQYVNRKIIPAIEKAAYSGRTQIAMRNKNITGETNVNLR